MAAFLYDFAVKKTDEKVILMIRVQLSSQRSHKVI